MGSPEFLAALGALSSGMAAMLSAIVSLMVQKKHLHSECDNRVQEVKRAFREGMKVGKTIEKE